MVYALGPEEVVTYQALYQTEFGHQHVPLNPLFFIEKFTSKSKFLKAKGNGDLPSLLARVMDKSKACLNCHSVFILRVCRVGD